MLDDNSGNLDKNLNASLDSAGFNDKKKIKTIKKVYPQIYSYSLPDLHDHDGWQKVGYTERKNVEERIKEQTRTAGINEKYKLNWSGAAIYSPRALGAYRGGTESDQKRFTDAASLNEENKNISDEVKNKRFGTRSEDWFDDVALHKFYVENGIERSASQEAGGFGREWFYFDGTPDKSRELFEEFRERDYRKQLNNGKIQYALRPEQEEAVSKTLEYARTHQTVDLENPNPDADYLWNAKPRFGKTLATYDFAKRFGAKKVLIVTNRPSIANSWFDDFTKFVTGYCFVSTSDSLKEKATWTNLQYEKRLHDGEIPSGTGEIVFLSLQDLKGAKVFGGKYDKLEWVKDTIWDLLVFDEAHEAGDTEKTIDAFSKIKFRFKLQLSGTPFKALANDEFKDEQIYNWTYLDEQKAKEAEIESGDDAGAHVNLPDMRLFTYKMSDMISDRLEGGVVLDDGKDYSYAFDLNEMFSTKSNGEFVHEEDVNRFLDELTTNKKYPFSTPELRDELKHTFWLVGNRVTSAKAMAKLLRKHPTFKDYEVVVAAGDGKISSEDDETEEEVNNFAENEKSLDRVRKAIKENDKTITLSVGQLTTGVTIKEWSAVLMLSDIKSEALYMQAIFRAQNPWEYFDENGNYYRKKSAYVFDFSPKRVLEVYDKFANGLQNEAVSGEITESVREKNVAKLLNYFPVLAEDDSGEMIELDANKVMTYPKAIYAKEIVNRGFITNLLFKIPNVFNIPREIINTLNKTHTTNDSARTTKTEDVKHDENREEKKKRRISINKENILGPKVYGLEVAGAVEEASKHIEPEEKTQTIVDRAMTICEEPLERWKEIYAPSSEQAKKAKEKIEGKIRTIADEYVQDGLDSDKKRKELSNKITDVIENDLPNDTVEQSEEIMEEKEEKTELDQVRSKLRTFARAIPSFIMAAKNPDEITLDNIETTVSDEDFEELFTERDGEPFTKDDFRKIRGPYVCEDGTVFEGFFDKYIFNAAIREFEERRKKLADYLDENNTEDIFSYIRPLKTNQIFTPRKVVNMMLNKLEEYDPQIFRNPDNTFIDLYVKSGLYLTEIAKRLDRGIADKIPDREERIKHIFEKQLYGLAPTRIIYDIAHKYIFGIDRDGAISDRHFVKYDATMAAKNGTLQNKLNKIFKPEGGEMKFTAVVGNPPYQETMQKTDKQTQANSNWIYYYFQNSADKIGETSCLIYPFGGWFDSPKDFGGFGNKLLTDEHTISINAFEGTSDKRAWYRVDQEPKPIFGNNANLSAGVSIVLRSNRKTNDFQYSNRVYCDDIVTVNISDVNFITSDPRFAHINKKLGTERLYRRIKKGVFGIESDFAEKNPDKVSHSKNDWQEPIQLLTNDKSGSAGRATWFWTDRKFIPKGQEYINMWKIVTTSAYPKKTFVSGKPTLSNVKERSKTLVEELPSDSAFGRSRLSLILSKDKNECDNFKKYSQTNFFAGLMLQEPNRCSSFGYVIPDQDFTNNSDIDWSKSIPEIDRQLYKKYDLNQEEIDFIEQKVKPME